MKTLIKARSLFLDSSSPYVCNIFNGCTPSERFLHAPDPEPAPGGGNPGGDPPPNPGGDPPPAPPKTFTQAEFDRTIGQVRAEERKKFADYDKLKEQVAKLADDSAKRKELEEELERFRQDKELEGASAEAKERAAGERARQALERERTESKKKLDDAEARATANDKKWKDEKIGNALGAGLDSAKVLTTARTSAIRIFRDDATVDLDDHGNITAVSYGGVLYKTANEAAIAFLKENDHFASAGRPVGGNSKLPSGGGLPAGKTLFDLSQDELLTISAQRDQQARQGNR